MHIWDSPDISGPFMEKIKHHPDLKDLKFDYPNRHELAKSFTAIRLKGDTDRASLVNISKFINKLLEYEKIYSDVKRAVDSHWKANRKKRSNRIQAKKILAKPEDERKDHWKAHRERVQTRIAKRARLREAGLLITDLKELLVEEDIPLNLDAADMEEVTRDYRSCFGSGAAAQVAFEYFMQSKDETGTPRYTDDQIKLALDRRRIAIDIEHKNNTSAARKRKPKDKEAVFPTSSDEMSTFSGEACQSASEEERLTTPSWPHWDGAHVGQPLHLARENEVYDHNSADLTQDHFTMCTIGHNIPAHPFDFDTRGSLTSSSNWVQGHPSTYGGLNAGQNLGIPLQPSSSSYGSYMFGSTFLPPDATDSSSGQQALERGYEHNMWLAPSGPTTNAPFPPMCTHWQQQHLPDVYTQVESFDSMHHLPSSDYQYSSEQTPSNGLENLRFSPDNSLELWKSWGSSTSSLRAFSAGWYL